MTKMDRGELRKVLLGDLSAAVDAVERAGIRNLIFPSETRFWNTFLKEYSAIVAGRFIMLAQSASEEVRDPSRWLKIWIDLFETTIWVGGCRVIKTKAISDWAEFPKLGPEERKAVEDWIAEACSKFDKEIEEMIEQYRVALRKRIEWFCEKKL
jgi:hypothetical protein